MPEIKIEIKNLAEIKRAFGMAPRLMVKELNFAIRRSAASIHRRQFSKYHELGIRIVSRGLYASIQRGIWFGNLKAEIGPDAQGSRGVEYSRYVHWGTRYMKARPWLYEAVSDSEMEINENMRRAVQSVLNSIGRAT